MLDLTDRLDKRAAGLTADGKQKISLGRGLVRDDVNAILFDEPLTVIDPHLKWQLRSKLKELHQQIGVTMIYVTHDQVEALTFADKVVVMYDGAVVQVGTPVELFNRPQPHLRRLFHRLARYERAALHARRRPAGVRTTDLAQHHLSSQRRSRAANSRSACGRNSFASAMTASRSRSTRSRTLAATRWSTALHEDESIKMVVGEDESIPAESPRIVFDPDYTLIYHNDWVVGGPAS